MFHDPGFQVSCKSCDNRWYIKEEEFIPSMLKNPEEGRKYFLCNKCGEETNISVNIGDKYMELDYKKFYNLLIINKL
jgi:uncharacterized protein YlaI